MGIHSNVRGYRSLSEGACSTRTWMLRLAWSRDVLAAYERGGKYAVALDRLLTEHRRRLPSSLSAGREVLTVLVDQYLFPDTILLLTACGSHPSWERARAGKARLFSRIGYSNDF